MFELVGGAVGDDLAAIDNDGARTGGFDFFENVGGKDDRLFLAHAADEAAHFVFLVGVEAVGRLVEDEDVGIVNDDCAKQVRWR